MNGGNNRPGRGGGWLIGLALVLGTLACYWPARLFDFVNYDDQVIVTQNPVVLRGLTWPGLRYAFLTTEFGYRHPLAFLSHELVCQFWGLNAGAHHLANVAVHLANVWLVFVILRRLTGATWRSAFVAAAFAWHPMQVESVAWVTERKGLLAAFFGLLAIWAYAHYAEVQSLKSKVQRREAGAGSQKSEGRSENPSSHNTQHASGLLPSSTLHPRSSWFYILSLLFFACSLMSKPTLVAFPFLLLLIDYWPLHRLELRTQNSKLKTLLPLLLEKLPFLLLALVAGAETLLAQKQIGIVWTTEALSLRLRLENVVVSYATYCAQYFWPVNLAVFYPYPKSYWTSVLVCAGVLLLAVSALVLWQGRKRPYLAVGWLWFLGALTPVIGLVQNGLASRADRYMYMPSLGLLIMAAWGGAALLGSRLAGGKQSSGRTCPEERRGRVWRYVRLGLGGLALTACFISGRAQLACWRNTVTLFEHAAAATMNNYVAQGVLGSEAESQGRLEEAEARFREAVRMAPEGIGAHRNLGRLLAAKGSLEEAAFHFEQLIRLAPQGAESHNYLGRVRLQQRRLEEAVALFSQAIKLKPNWEEPHYNLALAYGLQDRMEELVAESKIAVRLAPGDARAQSKLTSALVKIGRADEAIRHCQAEAQARPKDPLPHYILGGVYVTQNRLGEAVAQFKEALRMAPDNPAGLNDLAWLCATHPSAEVRNGAEAVRLAERACQLTRRKAAPFLDTLAAAYAEAGRFAEAVRTAREAQTLALAADDSKTAAGAAERIEWYKTARPWRDPATPK